MIFKNSRRFQICQMDLIRLSFEIEGNDEISLNLPRSEKIKEIAATIAETLKLNPESIILIYCGEELPIEESLENLSITTGSRFSVKIIKEIENTVQPPIGRKKHKKNFKREMEDLVLLQKEIDFIRDKGVFSLDDDVAAYFYLIHCERDKELFEKKMQEFNDSTEIILKNLQKINEFQIEEKNLISIYFLVNCNLEECGKYLTLTPKERNKLRENKPKHLSLNSAISLYLSFFKDMKHTIEVFQNE